MKRFQNALKSHLTSQNEKVTLELRELTEALRNRKKEREDLGVDLYGIQQELARFQMLLEKNHDEFANLNQGRQQEEAQLDDVRNTYKETQVIVNKEKKKCKLGRSKQFSKPKRFRFEIFERNLDGFCISIL